LSENSIKALEPVIAVVIIVAVALVITIGFVGWITGFWSNFITTHSESIYIYPDSYYNVTEKALYLHLKTNIKPKVIISGIKVDELEVQSLSLRTLVSGSVEVNDNGDVVASVGSEFWLKVITSGAPSAGSTVHVKLYTDSGFVYWSDVQTK